MSNFKFIIGLLVIFNVFLSCNNDDDNIPEVEIRDIEQNNKLKMKHSGKNILLLTITMKVFLISLEISIFLI